jgi:hypothetical protein
MSVADTRAGDARRDSQFCMMGRRPSDGAAETHLEPKAILGRICA